MNQTKKRIPIWKFVFAIIVLSVSCVVSTVRPTLVHAICNPYNGVWLDDKLDNGSGTDGVNPKYISETAPIRINPADSQLELKLDRAQIEKTNEGTANQLLDTSTRFTITYSYGDGSSNEASLPGKYILQEDGSLRRIDVNPNEIYPAGLLRIAPPSATQLFTYTDIASKGDQNVKYIILGWTTGECEYKEKIYSFTTDPDAPRRSASAVAPTLATEDLAYQPGETFPISAVDTAATKDCPNKSQISATEYCCGYVEFDLNSSSLVCKSDAELQYPFKYCGHIEVISNGGFEYKECVNPRGVRMPLTYGAQCGIYTDDVRVASAIQDVCCTSVKACGGVSVDANRTPALMATAQSKGCGMLDNRQCYGPNRTLIPSQTACTAGSDNSSAQYLCCSSVAACNQLFETSAVQEIVNPEPTTETTAAQPGLNIFTGPTAGDFNTLNPFVIFKSPFAETFTSPAGIINRAMSFVFPLSGLILFVMLVWAGFEMVYGATNKKGMDAGKQRATNALIGFVLLFCSYWIVQIIEYVFGLAIL